MNNLVKALATVVFVVFCGFSDTQAQSFTGEWYGAMDVQGMKLDIVFHIDESEGGYTATFDSPLQGAFGIPFTSTAVDGANISLKLENIGASFDGVLADELISGLWKQSGSEFELVLSKGKAESSRPNRPQEPTRPYPYKEEEIRFTNVNDQIELAGTLTMPHGGGNFPAVILISGSGPQDRDETFMTHKPFLVFADHLTRNGIAVLRFDDRGFGESEGDHSIATSLDFASDVEAAFQYLQARPEINKKHIGLAGHSEGGLIAPITASQNEEVAFIILLAGPGINGLEIQKQQIESFGPGMGLTDEQITIEKRNVEEIAEIVRTHEPGEQLTLALTQFFEEKLGDMEQVQGIPREQYIQAQISQLNRPWFKYFINHEPSDYLQHVRVPILAINGEKDIQVTADNLAAIEQSVMDKELITIKEYPGMNHLFQECTSCMMSEYAQIEETISPLVLTDITDWIQNVITRENK
ncbi:alpha/beta hydrolase family protein [Rhodohalobacter mucosus]|uniref:Alpha/beta hydrolase n=1 Tax=Rhodohalobacter mucosus TaxID=2079485 RepID=A0A316TXL6_9BACT|nr:alpha/beta hydrolase [Rhodohalobacter mucosus]PWN07384.1 alpha/beta hydrolase [Rhodohalobacter mucosus]